MTAPEAKAALERFASGPTKPRLKLVRPLLAYAIATWDTAGEHTDRCHNYVALDMPCDCGLALREQAQATVARALEGK